MISTLRALVPLLVLAATGCSSCSNERFDPATPESLIRFGDQLGWVIQTGVGVGERVVVRDADGRTPARVIWDSGNVDAITGDADTLMVAVAGPRGLNPEVLLISAGAEVPSRVAALPTRASALAAVGDVVLVRAGDTLFTLTPESGAVPLTDTCRNAIGLAATSTRAVWMCAEGDRTEICTIPIGGGAVSCGSDGPRDPSASLLASGETVWIARGFDGEARIERLAAGSARPEVVVHPAATVGALAVDDGRVFWTEGDGRGVWARLMRLGDSGAARVAVDEQGFSVLAVDRTHLWWGSANGIRRIAR